MTTRSRYIVPLIGIAVGSIFVASSLFALSVSERMVGRILLQVEKSGEAWYVNPANKKRIFMGRPADAFRIMRELGVGITDANLARIPVGITEKSGTDEDADGLADAMEVALGTDFLLADTDVDGYDDRTEIFSNYDPLKGNGARLVYDLVFTAKQAGRILLQVERNGEAWYVNPADQKRYFLGRPTDAFAVMRATGVGISNKNIDTIQVDTVVEKEMGTLSGKITLASGNCMPMICDNPPCPSSCRIIGASRNIYIREAAHSNAMDSTYLKEKDKPNLVKTVTSDSDGSFTAILPVGTYSFFAEDDGREYCNSRDGQGLACMFEIKKGQTTKYDSQIDHAAW